MTIFRFPQRRIQLLAAFIGLLALSSPTPGQSAPFDSLTIGINAISNPNRNVFHDFWTPATGAEGYAAMPFYLGDIRLGLQYLPYKSVSGIEPDFNSLFGYLQWDSRTRSFSNVYARGGVRIGLFQMRFAENNFDLSEGLIVEREFAVGASLGLNYNLYKHWRLSIGSSYVSILTEKKIELLFLSFGISRTFPAPQWLKNFLK